LLSSRAELVVLLDFGDPASLLGVVDECFGVDSSGDQDGSEPGPRDR
jgi:hypothetical protein